MKIFLLVISVALVLLSGAASSSPLSSDQQKNVDRIINAFKTGDRRRIASVISYPLERKYPLTDIRSKAEMLRHFDEVFDPAFVKHIAASKPEDWSNMGWRGIMLDHGSVWLNDYEHITGVNHRSPMGERLLAAAIAADKASLPTGLRNFKQPAYLILTKHYRIRIDELVNGTFRYMSWKRSSQGTQPDLVLRNGKEVGGGSGGFDIAFRNGVFTYSISVNFVHGPEAGAISLSVSEGEHEVLLEEGQIVRR